MDIAKPKEEITRKKRRRIVIAGAGVVLVTALVVGVSRLAPASPAAARGGLWIDAVQEGAMARELRGVGTLVADDGASIWAAAELDGRIDRKLLEAGASVTPSTVLLQMSNPDVEQAAIAADLALAAAKAALASLEASLESDLLAQRSAAAAVEADRTQAAIQAEVDATLSRDGLLSDITSRQSGVRADALGTRVRLEQDRLRTTERSVGTRLAVQQAEVESRQTVAALKRRDRDSLTVRAGMTGVLQELVVQVGQRVTRGANLARVVDPARLKAELRIPEAQTTDLRLGLTASVDTHNGVVSGKVVRIAPAAQNGTVTVDVQLTGDLPRGARPDMTVDGSVELERLDGVRHIARPVGGSQSGTAALYRVSADGATAERVTVHFGRTSANRVEIIDGDLRAGDRVVLSDTSAWGNAATVRLR